MVELALLGEILPDYSMEELKSYNGEFPLWKRLLNAARMIKVWLETFNDYCRCFFYAAMTFESFFLLFANSFPCLIIITVDFLVRLVVILMIIIA